jgi:hypothetical protein
LVLIEISSTAGALDAMEQLHDEVNRRIEENKTGKLAIFCDRKDMADDM